MTVLVALTGWDIDLWVNRLKRLMSEREIVALGEPFDRRAVNYAVSWKHPPGALSGLPNLAAIFSLGAGVDHLFADPRLPDVPIARVVDPNLTARMSEYVVMHCLAQLRQYRRYQAQQREKLWDDDRFQPAAADVRVGVMGLGVLGLDAVAKLRTMGFDVAGWSRTPKTCPGIETFSGTNELTAFLGRTDILVVLLPLTAETRGIIARPLIDRLARDGRLGGSVLINAGRGGLQVEADILAALEAGTLREAVLDVFETEPLPTTSPLWTHPAVTITPHNAAMSDPDAIGRLIARQIARLEEGLPLDHAVEIARGY
jgi:glyoxylate/hydroxypyruvate reductase A